MERQGSAISCLSTAFARLRLNNNGAFSIDDHLTILRPSTGWDEPWVGWPGRSNFQYRAWLDTGRATNGQPRPRINIQFRTSDTTRNRVGLIRHTPLPGSQTVSTVRGVMHPRDNPVADWGQAFCWSGLVNRGEETPTFQLQLES